jgi:hypothetical protein
VVLDAGLVVLPGQCAETTIVAFCTISIERCLPSRIKTPRLVVSGFDQPL